MSRAGAGERRRPGTVGPIVALLAAGAFLAPGALGAQQPDPLRRASDLERQGSYGEAIAAYRGVLAQKPADAAALFGLERSLIALNRGAEILPQVRAAIAASPTTGAFYAVAVRAWGAADQPDSLRATVERWAAAVPGDEAPYREWGAAALARRDRAEARRAYLVGRERLGRPDALAPELALLAAQDQAWSDALREWLAAVGRAPGYRATAAATLAPAPDNARPELLAALRRETGPAARRLEADLRARWGDPVGGFELLSGALPADRARAIEALSGFLDQLRGLGGAAAKRAQGLTLAALAERSGGPQGARLRLEAAEALADGGDQAGARALLSGVAGDTTLPTGLASGASTALVAVLLSEGKVEEADAKLRGLAGAIPADDYDALRRRVARGWARAGRLDRAESLVAGDSSVDGLALAGRLHLYRGDVAGALKLLQAAGPFAGSREEATARIGLLAMLQPIEADSLPSLGRALLALEQGDTAAAVTALERLAEQLPPDQGGAEVRLYAGTVARATGKTADAERLFRAAAAPEAKATAPAAELALARLLMAGERAPEAVRVLEHLILTYPESALVPQARRALDEARGGVPRT